MLLPISLASFTTEHSVMKLVKVFRSFIDSACAFSLDLLLHSHCDTSFRELVYSSESIYRLTSLQNGALVVSFKVMIPWLSMAVSS